MARLFFTFALFFSSVLSAAAAMTHALDPDRYHLGDNAYTHTTDYEMVDSNVLTGTRLEVPFRLNVPTVVAVHIDRLWGVGGQHLSPNHNYVYLDRANVGRILPPSDGNWTSAGVRLREGDHVAVIRSQGPGDHDDFVLEGISVVTTDRVGVNSGGPSRIFTEGLTTQSSSVFGASQDDVDNWMRIRAQSLPERRLRELEEENRQVLRAALGGSAGSQEIAAATPANRVFRAERVFQETVDEEGGSELPQYSENSAALEIVAIRLEPDSPIHAGGAGPMLVMELMVDQAFAVRGARPALHWRWVSESGENAGSFGDGPVRLGAVDRPDPTVRFRLPLVPPTSGEWRLEVTVLVGTFGDRSQLVVQVD